MIRSDESWLSLVDSFHAAGLGEQSWEIALQGLADATGSRSAQLSGIHHCDTSVFFSAMTNMDPAIPRIFAETAAINPRVAAANAAPVLEAMSDWDFMTPEAYRRDRFCQEILQPFDIPFICLTTVERNDQAFVALAIIRSHREGHITPEQRQVFAAIAPHVRAAVRTHVALQGHGIAVLTQAMETLSIPVFVCDQTGKVVALTMAAEALVGKACPLQLKAGRLSASQSLNGSMLNDAIHAAAVRYQKPGPPASRTVIIRGEPDAAPIVLDVFPLPCRYNTPSLANIEPRVLVVVRGSRGTAASRAAILQAMYGLSSAETRIAVCLAEGKTAEVIAIGRGVAVGTVRAQIKTILAKVGVRRQIELTARLSQI
jgi:DNA-binding CsgD family transcriptional regulator